MLIAYLMTFAFAQTDLIKIDGSSTVFPITEAVAEEFQKARAVNITVGISGTGGGFKKFCRGETDIQNASRPIQASEMEVCRTGGVRYFELPVAFDAMAIVVNKDNTWVNEIGVAELKKMWEPSAQGKVMRWKHVNAKWPDVALKLFGAGSDSGTFDYFTEAVVGKAKSSRGDYSASEDDNVLVKGVTSEKGALAYIPLAYFEENRDQLKLLAVVGAKGQGVKPSRKTVESGIYAPLSRPIFLYVSEAALKRPVVKGFVEFYLTNARRLVEEVKYVPLPQSVYAMGLEHLKSGKVGTAFAGHSQVGMKIEDLLKMERRH